MALLYSIAIAAAARLGYKLAEDRKWLPGGLYRQLALDQLKSGDLERAQKYSKIALQKNPGDEKAGLVRELIAMRSDARLAALMQNRDRETEKLQSLEMECLRIERRLISIARIDRLTPILAGLLFLGTLSCYVFDYVLFVHSNRTVAASIMGGVAVLTTLITVSFIKTVPDRFLLRSLDQMELTASLDAMHKEIEMRRNRRRQLTESIASMKTRALDYEKN